MAVEGVVLVWCRADRWQCWPVWTVDVYM